MQEPANPYAPPQALAPPLRGFEDHPSTVRPYVSAQGKTFAAVAAEIALLVCQVLTVGSLLLQIRLLSTAEGGVIDPDAANRNDMRHYACAGLLIVAAIISLITLLVWVYHTHANLPALGAKHLDFSSGWAVGWFFIPIANLFKPYQAVLEIWNASDPRPLQGMAVTSSAIVGWWWVLRVISGFIERGITQFSRYANDIDSILVVNWAAVVIALALDIPLVLLQIRLLRKVQRFQDERYALIERQPFLNSTPGGNPFAG